MKNFTIKFHTLISVIFLAILLLTFISARKPTITIEAENMELSGGYQVEDENYIYGVKNIRIWPFLPEAKPGFAKYTFNGKEGIYIIQIHYYDENDAVCTYSFYINDNKLETWKPDKDLGDKHPVEKTRQVKEYKDITLKKGDVLMIEGIADVVNSSFAELARVDRIELYFVKPLPRK